MHTCCTDMMHTAAFCTLILYMYRITCKHDMGTRQECALCSEGISEFIRPPYCKSSTRDAVYYVAVLGRTLYHDPVLLRISQIFFFFFVQIFTRNSIPAAHSQKHVRNSWSTRLRENRIFLGSGCTNVTSTAHRGINYSCSFLEPCSKFLILWQKSKTDTTRTIIYKRMHVR